MAAALLGGGGLGLSHDDFTDTAAADPARLALAGRVRCVADDESTAIFPHQFPAVLTAHLDSGESVTERIVANRGGPDRPLGDDEVAEKFRTNAVRSVSEQDVPAVVDAVRELRGGRASPISCAGRAHFSEHCSCQRNSARNGCLDHALAS